MNISDVLKNQLSKPSHIVKITDKVNGLRLKKASGLMRYSYSENEILEEFETIENFIQNLQQNGYENTSFLFQRTYGGVDNATYHTMKEVTENLQTYTSNNTNSAMTSNTPSPMQNQQPNFLAGTTPAGQNMQFLGAMVQSERAGDYLKKVNELEEDTKDYRSKIRRLEEENHSLKLKEATSQERTDLRIRQELLDKKGFLESDGFQKISDGLGALIPHIPAFLNKGAPSALGAPLENLSPLKAQVFELIKNASEDDVSFVAYVLQNMDASLVDKLTQHIENSN